MDAAPNQKSTSMKPWRPAVSHFPPASLYPRGWWLPPRWTRFRNLKNGKFIVIELDGTPFHTETPVEAHERTTMFSWEGAHIERISAAECDTPEKAQRVAKQIQDLINKLLANR
jgi:hypothetical protein